jgi:hypothetical protein
MVKSIFISTAQFYWDAIELQANQAIQERIPDQAIAESMKSCQRYAVNDHGNLQPDIEKGNNSNNSNKSVQNQRKFEYTLAPQLIPDDDQTIELWCGV